MPAQGRHVAAHDLCSSCLYGSLLGMARLHALLRCAQRSRRFDCVLFSSSLPCRYCGRALTSSCISRVQLGVVGAVCGCMCARMRCITCLGVVDKCLAMFAAHGLQPMDECSCRIARVQPMLLPLMLYSAAQITFNCVLPCRTLVTNATRISLWLKHTLMWLGCSKRLKSLDRGATAGFKHFQQLAAWPRRWVALMFGVG